MRKTEWLEKDNGELSWGSSGIGENIPKKKIKKRNKKFLKLQEKKLQQFMKDFPKWHTSNKEEFDKINLIMYLEEKSGGWRYNG